MIDFLFLPYPSPPFRKLVQQALRPFDTSFETSFYSICQLQEECQKPPCGENSVRIKCLTLLVEFVYLFKPAEERETVHFLPHNCSASATIYRCLLRI